MLPITKPLVQLSDDLLFELLDAVSEEVKRRNGLLGPPTLDKNQTVEQSVGTVLSALADLGIKFRGKNETEQNSRIENDLKVTPKINESHENLNEKK